MARTRNDRKENRRADADARNAAHSKLTPKERLAKLVARGHGHCEEAKSLR